MNIYDRKIKCLDEPHSPELLEKLSMEGTLNKGKFLTDAHRDSYFQQMLHIRRLGVESVLEVGPGEGVIASYIRSLGVQYDTMDIVHTSHPTIVSRLEDFDPSEHLARWDLVCAFQVLEHSPYEDFVSNLAKMVLVSKRYVFISLPFLCAGFSLSVNVALGQSLRLKRKFELYFPLLQRNREYRKEFKEEFPWAVHYWEIGRRGFPLSRIRRDIRSADLSIVHEFRSENPYHYFILAEKS